MTLLDVAVPRPAPTVEGVLRALTEFVCRVYALDPTKPRIAVSKPKEWLVTIERYHGHCHGKPFTARSSRNEELLTALRELSRLMLYDTPAATKLREAIQ